MAAAGKSNAKVANFSTAFMRIPRNLDDELRLKNGA
jgi:hypothetical protein